jgi:uncharacterized protein YukE
MENTVQKQDDKSLGATADTASQQLDAVRRQIKNYFDTAEGPSYNDYHRWQATLDDRVVRSSLVP